VVTFVALGDSTTAGFGDPMPDGSWRGWAALLAEGLAPSGQLTFYNLAQSGALASDVVEHQLPPALEHRPDVAALLVGVNDTLRAAFDIAGIGSALHQTARTLNRAGTVVLTACLPDPGRMFRLPLSLARPLGRRIGAINAVLHAVAHQIGGPHVHIPELPGAYDRRMWSVDRLHPGERGHRLLAVAAYDALVAAGVAVHRRPDLEPRNPVPTSAATAVWMATRGTRWILDRSTDLIPYLFRMALAEWWLTVRGVAHRLDEAVQADVSAALHGLDERVHAEVASALHGLDDHALA
jgi:lysophospholipase L1-like esterase